MTLVFAVHQVRRNPTGRAEFRGTHPESGKPIVRAVPDIHMPGSAFEISDAAELATLLEAGAVVLADDPSAMRTYGVPSALMDAQIDADDLL